MSDEKNPPTPQPRRKLVLAVLALVVVLSAAYFAWKFFFAPTPLPANIVALSGRIEGDDSALASKMSGRVVEVNVREGDRVHRGDVIARLDDEQIRARETQAQAGVEQALARSRSAEQQIAILNEQLRQSDLQAQQASQEATGRVSQAEAQLAAAEAELARQEAAFKLAAYDRDAYTTLAKSGAVSERRGKEAQTNADTQSALVASARRQVESARGALATAKSSLLTPQIRGSQTVSVRKEIVQQQSQVALANAQAEQARAQLAEAQANRQDLLVRAPFDGTVIVRSVEPGEVIAVGTPLVTLLDLREVYLRGFVAEGQIGRVKLGQPARVYLDSAPNQAIDAEITRIDPQATFTPENTYFREDRVKQVVGVKLQLKGSVGYAKPGMPADGEILVEGNDWPPHQRKSR